MLREQAARLLGRLGVSLDDRAAGPGGTALQVAALPYRVRGDAIEVLLVTSRRARRWILPKGWPLHGQALHESAAREAFEEAGVRGEIETQAIGRFTSTKAVLVGPGAHPPVLVFPMRVDDELGDWPERSERTRRWFGMAEALRAVAAEQRGVLETFADTRS